jgi:hypothetical protein
MRLPASPQAPLSGCRHEVTGFVSCALVVAAVLVAAAPAPDAAACTPSADRVLGWDLGRDLVIVGQWAERGRPPPGSVPPPQSFELRRLSTGSRVGDAADRGPPVRSDRALAARLRVSQRRRGTFTEVALEVRTRAGWRWLLWYHVMSRGEAAQEKRVYRLGPVAAAGELAMISVEMSAHGGNCSYSDTRALLVRLADLDDPRRPGRQAWLLAHVRRDHPFEHWLTIAALGPVPPDRVPEARQAHASVGQPFPLP